MNVEEAMRSGFINGVVDGFDRSSDWFDPSLIPCIPKLLASDLDSVMLSMDQLNQSKDLKGIEQVCFDESDALVRQWTSPEFLMKMMAYMKSFSKKG